MNKLTIERHTKIVCTLGPASSSPEVIERMLRGGMDIARLNLAHSTLEGHRQLISEVRSVSQELKPCMGILLDLPGLKRHIGDVKSAFGQHLEFALSQSADFIALSYISSAREVKEVKKLLKEMNADIPVIAKIERAQALQESDMILDICEGIMVARGDLALDISFEKVPLASKRLIKEANRQGKPVIIATEMLESMVRSATPTRAEAADIANAVEASLPFEQMFRERWQDSPPEVNDATARAACQVAHQVQAKAIVAFTAGGTTAFRVSKYRPYQPILAVTPSERIMRRLSLYCGVVPIRKPDPKNLEEVFGMASEVALETTVARRGDLIVITAGLPLTAPGSTNLLKVHSV